MLDSGNVGTLLVAFGWRLNSCVFSWCSALEKAESTVFVASGMYAAVAMLSALVPAGGHIVTTTDCYRKTRIYMETELPKRGISVIPCDLLSSTCF
jgi:cystathionine beta-lyase/cystathionine gamma-synthase